MKAFQVLVLLGCCVETAASQSFDGRWTRGLKVQAEPVPGETAVNGMQFRMFRVTGRDVPVLFARILAEWNAAPGGNAPRLLHQGEWTVASRIHGGHSETAQWRTVDAGAELLWSDTDLMAAPSAARLPRYLPSGCVWNGPVHGRTAGWQFLQATGFCRARPPAVVAELQRALREEGWQTSRTPAGLRAGRGGSALEAIVSPADGRNPGDQNAATMVIVETHGDSDATRNMGRQ